jgi:two-component system chemotaxis response regulator CheB
VIRVLLIEDSRSTIAYIERLLRAERDFDVLPTATDGASGVESAKRHKPSVILMDLELPALDGVSAIHEIMVAAPCPIVVLSAYLKEPGRDRTFESLQAGAVDVLAKPTGLLDRDIQGFRERLVATVRLMSHAHVVRRFGRAQRPPVTSSFSSSTSAAPSDASTKRIVLFGASTGGPAVLEQILRAVPPPFPLPIVIAQHTIPGFEHGLARWLAGTGHATRVVTAPGLVLPSEVAIAPAHQNLTLRGGLFDLAPPAGRGPVPSADVLFQSAADSFGKDVIAILLTGMGDDGARGLLALRRRGALTITQQDRTCVIDGMPAAARALGAQEHDLSPDDIGDLLRRIKGARAL